MTSNQTLVETDAASLSTSLASATVGEGSPTPLHAPLTPTLKISHICVLWPQLATIASCEGIPLLPSSRRLLRQLPERRSHALEALDSPDPVPPRHGWEPRVGHNNHHV